MGKQSYNAGIHVSMTLQLRESLQCILHLLEQGKKTVQCFPVFHWENESISWEKHKYPSSHKENPYTHQVYIKKVCSIKKKKGTLFSFFYAILSPKYNTVRQESDQQGKPHDVLQRFYTDPGVWLGYWSNLTDTYSGISGIQALVVN